MSNLIIAIVVGVIVGIGSTAVTATLLQDNSSSISLNDEEKEELEKALAKCDKEGHQYDGTILECQDYVYSIAKTKHQLGF